MSFKLLPKTTAEFSDAKFWESFFKTRGSKAFEWYGEYQDMVDLWAQYIKSGDRVINIGCGNSNLGAELHDRQNCDVLCIDTSSTVVQQMARKHAKRPRLAYKVMDAAHLEGLEDGSFACAVDKGTLDALMSSADSTVEGIVDAMLAEVHRVLRVGGRHLIVSLCQQQVVDKFLQHISARSWIARVHQATAASAGDSSGFPLPVFFIALTKLRPPTASTADAPLSSIVQVQDAYSTGPPERLDSISSLANWIRQVQLTAYSLSRPKSSGDSESEAQFTYNCGRTGLPMFTCYLLTHPAAPSRRRTGYAVFIEPLGSSSVITMSPYQRRDLLETQTNLRRLLFVRLHPWLHYQSDKALQASLSRLVMAFAPEPGMPESQVPFLSTGNLAYPYQTIASEVGYIIEQSIDGEELRLLKPDSDLSPLLFRATCALVKLSTDSRIASAMSKSDIVAHAAEHPLGRLLDGVIGDAASLFIDLPPNLDWLLTSKLRRPERQPPSLHYSQSSPAVKLLAQYFNTTCIVQLPTDSTGFRLIAIFPPVDSLSMYTKAVSPESIAKIAEFVDSSGGCLVLSSRLFDKKSAAINANSLAVEALRQCNKFFSVFCATFFDEHRHCECCHHGEGDDEIEDDRRRCWIACACSTEATAAMVEELLLGLPGIQIEGK